MTRHSGFTLIELVVVISIVTLLLGLLLPAVFAARNSARRIQCMSNMRRIGVAIHQYLEVKDSFPPSKTKAELVNPTRTIQHCLFTFLLPYIEYNDIWGEYNFSVNWQATVNRPVRQTWIPLYICPDAPSERRCRSTTSSQTIVDFFPSDYLVCEYIRVSQSRLGAIGVTPPRSDKRSLLRPDWDGFVRPEMIRDGLSNTFMLFECGGRPYKYEYGGKHGDPDVTPKEPMSGTNWADPDIQVWLDNLCGPTGRQMFNCSNKNELFSFHQVNSRDRGAMFLYGDGAVRFHLDSMDPNVFVSLFTSNGEDAAVFP
ncbi:MAG: DUF1559 domain-containing protein [Thermoguttaceae bacterium]